MSSGNGKVHETVIEDLRSASKETRPVVLTAHEQLSLDRLAGQLREQQKHVETLQQEWDRVQKALPAVLEQYAATRNRLMGAIDMICHQHGVDPDQIEWDASEGVKLSLPVKEPVKPNRAARRRSR